jgi:hypothetical protein
MGGDRKAWAKALKTIWEKVSGKAKAARSVKH